MMLSCPLSRSSKIVLLETIAVDDLVKLYKRFLKSNLSSEFSGVKEINFYHCPDSDLRFFYPMITGSENFYEKLQNIKWYYKDDKEEYEYARHYIKESDVILEIGCGKGAFSKKIPAQEYVGLEFSQRAKNWAEKHNITVLNESVQEHSLKNSEKYSVVCAFQVLEHVSEIYSFIEASVKCLKPGGILIYSVPSSDSFIYHIKNYILNMPPHHVSWWSDKALKNIAHLFGLQVINIHHEKLANVHRKTYLSSIFLKVIESRLGFRSPNLLIDCSLVYRILSKISMIGGKWLEMGFHDDRVLPIGESVTVVYKKRLMDS